VIGAIALLAASPALIFGVGPLPRLEMVGAGLALALYFTFASLFPRALHAIAAKPIAPGAPSSRVRHFREILGVGGLSAVGTVQANLTVALVTGAVGHYATEAIAGYGSAPASTTC
jgi:Na+-driven multidrug efflux pump